PLPAAAAPSRRSISSLHRSLRGSVRIPLDSSCQRRCTARGGSESRDLQTTRKWWEARRIVQEADHREKPIIVLDRHWGAILGWRQSVRGPTPAPDHNRRTLPRAVAEIPEELEQEHVQDDGNGEVVQQHQGLRFHIAAYRSGCFRTLQRHQREGVPNAAG